MADDIAAAALVPITGRRLASDGPVFALRRKADADYGLGVFRAWAGYKDLGADAATGGLALFQHVFCFAPMPPPGRTGIHCHLAQAHIVIPTSGGGTFSYDGVVTEIAAGDVIVQHGGTVHDQFAYSCAGGSPAATKATAIRLEPAPAGAPVESFGFLELFVPARIANVEFVPPGKVTADDQASAWDHAYHAPGASFALQRAGDPTAAWRPVAGQPALEARDGHTWAPSGELVATWFVRPAEGSPHGHAVNLCVPGERGGLRLLFVAAGSVRLERTDGETVHMAAGDCLTCGADLVGEMLDSSPDLRLVLIYISARAEALRERTAAEIQRLEALGPAIVTRRLVRPAHDDRPVNFLRDEDPAPV